MQAILKSHNLLKIFPNFLVSQTRYLYSASPPPNPNHGAPPHEIWSSPKSQPCAYTRWQTG